MTSALCYLGGLWLVGVLAFCWAWHKTKEIRNG